MMWSIAIPLALTGCLSLGDLLPEESQSPTDGAFGFVEVDGQRLSIDIVDRAQWITQAGTSWLDVSAKGDSRPQAVSFVLTIIDIDRPIVAGSSYGPMAYDGSGTGAAIALGVVDGLTLSGDTYCFGGDSDGQCLTDGDQGEVDVTSLNVSEVELAWDLTLVGFDEEQRLEVPSRARVVLPLDSPTE